MSHTPAPNQAYSGLGIRRQTSLPFKAQLIICCYVVLRYRDRVNRSSKCERQAHQWTMIIKLRRIVIDDVNCWADRLQQCEQRFLHRHYDLGALCFYELGIATELNRVAETLLPPDEYRLSFDSFFTKPEWLVISFGGDRAIAPPLAPFVLTPTFVKSSHEQQQIGSIVVRHGVIGLERDGFLIGSQGFLKTLQILKYIAK